MVNLVFYVYHPAMLPGVLCCTTKSHTPASDMFEGCTLYSPVDNEFAVSLSCEAIWVFPLETAIIDYYVCIQNESVKWCKMIESLNESWFLKCLFHSILHIHRLFAVLTVHSIYIHFGMSVNSERIRDTNTLNIYKLYIYTEIIQTKAGND